MFLLFSLIGVAQANVELTSRDNDVSFERRQSVTIFEMSTALAAANARTAVLETQVSMLMGAGSPIGIGVQAIATDMTARTIDIVTNQAAMSTQMSTVVDAVNAQLVTAAASASSAAAAADTRIQSAIGSITSSVSSTVASLQTNVSTLVAASGGTGDGSSPKNAGASCKAIKTAFPSSSNGNFYIKNPLGLSAFDAGSSSSVFGQTGPDGSRVLYVNCNFNTWMVTKPGGTRWRFMYVDGMDEPFEVHTFRAEYDFVLKGAAGGERHPRNGGGNKGGLGGTTTGKKSFNLGDKFYIYPGGKGGMNGFEDHQYFDDMWSTAYPKVHVGGFNGGGRGTRGGSGGGGGTDLRTVKHNFATESARLASLRTRFAVAGGGGGCGHGSCDYRGGHGGGGNGEDAWNGAQGGRSNQGGRNNCNHWRSFGFLGVGGSIDIQQTRNDGGGGGGGYWGGSAACTDNRPGAGGSGFAGGLRGASTVTGGTNGNAGHGYVDLMWKEL